MKTVTFLNDRVSIHIGDVVESLAKIGSDSVDCVVTSPPYWGLRDYGVDGQIGLEPTLAEHLQVMVAVFEEVRRVLKPTGTCWVNYGDCYATTPNGRSAADTKAAGNDDRTFRDKPFSTIQGVLKAKDLCMVPNRLAIALQESGWWVRSEIIWAKPNPMPESIRDRPATSHEKVFLLTKSARYFYDKDAVRQKSEGVRPQAMRAEQIFREKGLTDAHRSAIRAAGISDTGKVLHTSRGAGRNTPDVLRLAAEAKAALGGYYREFVQANTKERASDVADPRHAGKSNHTKLDSTPRGIGRNLRNYEPAPVEVWPIATQPFSDAHFATFPPELAERCILAGCPKGGLVLDPFGGAGTTALVALRHARRAELIELNPDYADIARRRIETEWKVPQSSKQVDLGPLFSEARTA